MKEFFYLNALLVPLPLSVSKKTQTRKKLSICISSIIIFQIFDDYYFAIPLASFFLYYLLILSVLVLFNELPVQMGIVFFNLWGALVTALVFLWSIEY